MDLDDDFDPWAYVAEASGMPGHAPIQGEACWTAWEQGDEFYLHVDKLADACLSVLRESDR
jgi:hypothetical protein